ncbi:hypothetical protein BDV28DRAFT_77771 [Aspergillus coremiiformis]|uniref:DUF7728 domain-containing protein n=1 Tax=Aspergillus coremiiformis TaxID=138285 RepID=A0A5N6YTG1_9EURO|nr:hypothetical protein BDV28DRAFT_77771 [Aspergillus coremiiformis]
MHLRSLFLGSAAVLGANAFLVVPEVEVEPVASEAEFASLHPVETHASQQQRVDLLCTECPFREVTENGKVSWTDGFQTALSLNFSIEDGFLLANGHQIFPPPPPTIITAVQRRLSDGEESDPIPLGYAVEMLPLPSPPEEPVDLVAVRFTVLDLDSHPVPLNTVAINLIHDHKGNLYMVKTDIEDNTPNRVSWRQCRGKPMCLRRLLFNRIRALFAAAKARMLGIMGTKPHCGRPRPSHHDGMGPEGVPFSSEAEGHMGRPGHSHHHLHHGHHGNWERTVSRVVRFIVIPAALGVLAGLAASAVGMLIGQVVVFLWQRYRRSDRQESLEQGTTSEKQGLMTETTDDLPPAYSDEEGAAEAAPEHKD